MQPALPAQLVLQARQEHEEHKATPVQQAQPGLQEQPVLRAHKARKAIRELQERKVLRAHKGHKGCREIRDPMERMVRKGRKGIPDFKVRKAWKAPKGIRALLVQPDLSDQPGSAIQDLKVPLDHRAAARPSRTLGPSPGSPPRPTPAASAVGLRYTRPVLRSSAVHTSVTSRSTC